MLEFTPGQSATAINTSIKNALETMDQAKQCAVLWFEEILNRKLYLELGYSSINQYAMTELGFSKSRTGDFLSLCRTFKRLPALRAKVETGGLKYTTARVLAGVMNESNQNEWLEAADNKSRREVEHAVKRAKKEAEENAAGMINLLPLIDENERKADLPRIESTPQGSSQPEATSLRNTRPLPAAVVPVRVNLEMSPTQYARYEKLWELLRKRNDVSSDKVEALLEIMGVFINGEKTKARESDRSSEKRSTRVDLSGNSIPPAQIHIHQCPECARTTVQTSKGELNISGDELDKALCDCQIKVPGKRNTASIAPAVRRQVLATARHKCQRPGCHHTQFLEIHHIVPRNRGGSNQPENLIALCSTCHRLVHERKMVGVEFLAREKAGLYTYRNSLVPGLYT